MTSPPFKVSFFKKEDSKTHFSTYFSTENEAKDYANEVKGSGNEVLVYKEVSKDPSGDPPYQEWEMLQYGHRKKFKTIVFLSSPSFYVPLTICLFVYLLLRKNNGLPKIIA